VSIWRALILTLALLARPTPGWAHDALHDQRLPTIGPAPEFTLTSQDGAPVSLADFRGKVAAVTFIYTSCPDICPMLTAKMAEVQYDLGRDFGAKIAFISITVDPERDTPDVLKEYAQTYGANLAGWSFLTGSPPAILDVTHRYGVVVATAGDGGVDHTLLTSLVDPHGMLRVQYLGMRFDPDEFRRDLLSLLGGP
jgi:protein SCO1/2